MRPHSDALAPDHWPSFISTIWPGQDDANLCWRRIWTEPDSDYEARRDTLLALREGFCSILAKIDSSGQWSDG